MTSRKYDAIDQRVANEILRLHKRHPNLGHEGLLEALSQQGIVVDDDDMKRFLREHRIQPDVAKPSWGHVASGYALWGALADGGTDAGDGVGSD